VRQVAQIAEGKGFCCFNKSYVGRSFISRLLCLAKGKHEVVLEAVLVRIETFNKLLSTIPKGLKILHWCGLAGHLARTTHRSEPWDDDFDRFVAISLILPAPFSRCQLS
jgi:hypothetical protein